MVNERIKVGAKFGKWTVRKPFAENRLQAECECLCGKVACLFRGVLQAGNTKQCQDCMRKERASRRDPGISKLWDNHALSQSDWPSYAAFEAWATDKVAEGLQLYRIDTNKPHGPANSEFRQSRWDAAIAAIAAHRNQTIAEATAWTGTVSKSRVYDLYADILRNKDKPPRPPVPVGHAVRLRELVAEGLGLTAIAKATGWTSRTVKKWIAILGLTVSPKHPGRPKKPATPAMLDEINEMRVEGRTYAEIAAKYGVSVATCRRWIESA